MVNAKTNLPGKFSKFNDIDSKFWAMVLVPER